MDVLSHSLWGIVALGGKAGALTVAGFSVAPDVLAFGPFIADNLIRGKMKAGRPESGQVPSYVYRVYDLTHSLVVYGFIYLALYWLVGKTIAYASLAWMLHILMDIPTHARTFFPTRFLYPLSEFSFDGIPWSDRRILLGNLLLLTIAWGMHWGGFF